MVSRIAVIPARGGSKRIPQKNIVEFCGKPMIAWTIEAALAANVFDRVLVSTESSEIADVARHYGASVPFLRTKYFDDHSTVSQAVGDALVQLKNQGESFDHVVQLMANCPIRNAADIGKAVDFFTQGDHDFQISCFEFGWMNPWWAVKLDSDNRPEPLFPEALKQRSQDLAALYCPTGAVWMANTEAFLTEQTFYGRDYRFCPIPWWSAMDIDDYNDLTMAKAIMTMVMNDGIHSHRVD